MSVVDLVGLCGQSNLPGVVTKVYKVCEDDIDTWPGFVGGPTAGGKITLDGDIVLKPLKKWATFEVISETGEVKDMQMGATGSKSFNSTFDCKVQNTGPAATEWVEDGANGCSIIAVKTIQGHIRILGMPGLPVQQATAEGTTGMNAESERVWTLQYKASTGRPAPYYTGNIDLDDAT